MTIHIKLQALRALLVFIYSSIQSAANFSMHHKHNSDHFCRTFQVIHIADTNQPKTIQDAICCV